MRGRLVFVLPLLFVACGGDDDRTVMPAPTMSAAEIQRLDGEAASFGEVVINAWPDVDPLIERLDDDAMLIDPTGDLYLIGKDVIAENELEWVDAIDYEVEYTAANLASGDRVAFQVDLPGLEMSTSPDAPLLRAVDVYTFDDGRILEWVEWWNTDWLDFQNVGCFADDHCPALRETVDQYVEAWTARDADEVAALYADDARFTDGMYGLAADGADAIGGLAEVRFGSKGGLSLEVLELYAWTNGVSPPSAGKPDRGRLVSVAIHFRAEVESVDGTRAQEVVTTLVLGTRHESSVEADPDGLIHDETVYHPAASLLTGDESAVSAACLADMRRAASVPGVRDDLMEHNQELHPTFTSCTRVAEWETAVAQAGLDDLIDSGFIIGECAFNAGVFETPLCDIVETRGG